MALKMTKRGQLDNEVAYEFVCDTTTDLQAIDPKYVTMGSVATVIEGEAGFEVYMANSQKEWINLGSAANSSGENNNSMPAWINQDIIASLPETTSYETNGETHYYATNMSLDNHTIQGNIVQLGNSDSSYGCFSANISTSLTTSFFDYTQEPESNQEYYIICNSVPSTSMGLTESSLDTIIGPSQVSYNREDPHNILIYVTSESDILSIYKVPGYLCTALFSYNQIILASYLLSIMQPEAIYDISQLTYRIPQAGE